MKKLLIRSSAAVLAALVVTLSGCGGGGGGDDSPPPPPPPPPPPVSVSQALTTAAAVAANDTSVNSTATFTVLQSAGLPAVEVASPPKVRFAVFSDGQVKKDLTLSNVRFSLAKLVPGTNGNPDQWVSYVYRTETAAPGFGPGGNTGATAKQATTDPQETDAALAAQQLVLHADGYYTYKFKTDIKDLAQTNGVPYEPNRTHRVVIQLSYTNAAGQTIRVNPYFDFKLDASGKSVAATAAETRKMVDVATCNNCHDKLALHGGGRVDTQYCVVCHNPGTKDANSGNVLTLSTMVHKIHAGRLLHEKGENYKIWGYQNSEHDYSEVGFPQPIRNCVVCHDASNPATPQGGNWKSVPTKEACLSCHQSGTSSGFYATHVTTLKLGSNAASIPNSSCNNCHSASSQLNAEKVHWVQEMANAPRYEARIESVTVKQAATATADGILSVKYSVVNPATGTPYDLRQGCSGPTTKDTGGNDIVGCNSNYRWDVTGGLPTDKFGMFSVYLGVETLAGVTVDDVTATKSVAAYLGVDDGNHHYTADLAIPMGANGNARVTLLGAVSERRLDPVTRNPVGAVPPVSNDDLAYVPVKNAIKDVNIATGGTSSSPRRPIVSNDNCNSCHGILGLPMGTQTVAFHKGHRNNADGCAFCHNANQAGSYTLMADGSKAYTSTGTLVVGDSSTRIRDYATSSFLHESYQAKRFVHGIHYGAKRNYPFTHCMEVGGEYNKDGTNKGVGPDMGAATCTGGETLNFTPEVAYPGSLTQCANCHVNDSWKNDRSKLGSVVFKPTGTGMLDWIVISPKAATCTTCHDAKSVQTHVKDQRGAFGNFTQRELLFEGKVFEACDGCHAPGTAIGIDKAHAPR